jgi:hypothetical protein
MIYIPQLAQSAHGKTIFVLDDLEVMLSSLAVAGEEGDDPGEVDDLDGNAEFAGEGRQLGMDAVGRGSECELSAGEEKDE